MNWNYSEVYERVRNKIEELGYVPNLTHFYSQSNFPSKRTMLVIFKKKFDKTYYEHFLGLGYIPYQLSYMINTYEDLTDVWGKYKDKHGHYPNSTICNNHDRLPSWQFVQKVCGDRFEEFTTEYSYNPRGIISKKYYDEACSLLIQECDSQNKVLNHTELSNNKNLHSVSWYIKHCPENNVKTCSDFLEYLGLKKQLNKDYATELIHLKHQSLGRNLMYDDFRNPKDGEVGLYIIRKYWGTLNNMLLDLSLPINQESMMPKKRTIDQLKQDIQKLCDDIYQREGRRNISLSDINECDDCLFSGTYNRYFKHEMNMTIGQYIESIGFYPNREGVGMIYEFDDGETTYSKFEYQVSSFLKDKNYEYERDVLYSTFIDDYDGHKDCDYTINHNGEIWYVEVAGMLDYSKVNRYKDDYIREKYKTGLTEKETMLKANNVNYTIIYPEDLKKPLDEVFYFLQ
ncbi:hypothetical protein CIL05_06720 [Virgibacillus profundi]|uniref:Uncharacterized protein n=1 Tax=Virgibacillus profundi TaxID=2024555 RepID=A0A2A2IFY9_9BACI|nr:hypothetical protein [Virgibacillus profundi]PAV30154.1 hypothetical protein CIL05_06720 [Virgibacillus profundi]PXY54326.1 hypothetical protein CIT14_06805 [Virgibacillus profundi]